MPLRVKRFESPSSSNLGALPLLYLVFVPLGRWIPALAALSRARPRAPPASCSMSPQPARQLEASSPSTQPLPSRRRRSRCQWTGAELDNRAKLVAVTWARLSGHPVKLADARRVARLRLNLPAVLGTLQTIWDRPRGIGSCWKDLRAAEDALPLAAVMKTASSEFKSRHRTV